jgi:hypothetical protein
MSYALKFLNKLFGRSDKVEEKPVKSKYEGYEVVYLPLTGIYITKYKGKLLEKANSTSGVIDSTSLDWLFIAAHFKNEESAWKHIDKHIEQRDLTTAKVMTR